MIHRYFIYQWWLACQHDGKCLCTCCSNQRIVGHNDVLCCAKAVVGWQALYIYRHWYSPQNHVPSPFVAATSAGAVVLWDGIKCYWIYMGKRRRRSLLSCDVFECILNQWVLNSLSINPRSIWMAMVDRWRWNSLERMRQGTRQVIINHSPVSVNPG